MVTIAFIGAGSTVFARALLRDLFTFPELHDSEIRLMDIDADRLRDSETVARRVADQARADARITATTDRREALSGADYVINMIQVGGYEPATVIDFEIPKKYGLRQTIGDSLGIGGIMRGLRTIPVMLDIGKDMEELCPNALLLNYSNPMAILTWAMNRATDVRTVGLCHSVFGTAHELATILGLPAGEIDYLCAGINHMAFYLRLEHKGEDIYPRLRQIAAEDGFPSFERVRQSVLRYFGYFVTESSEHFSEYTPWFIKDGRQDLIDQYRIPLDEYPARCVDQINEWAEMRKALLSKDASAMDAYQQNRRSSLSGMWERRLAAVEADSPEEAEQMRAEVLRERSGRESGHSGEYGTLIIHSMETGQPRTIYGNVENAGSISNLPYDCVVEIPCLTNANGFQATQIGEMPPQLTAMMQTNINVQRLGVEAALTQKREYIYHAAMLDPHTGAELSLDEIVSMVDELIEAHGDYLPEYS
ncbi:MAG TPA: alpha-glucosidase/alpha-galactosidase [Thermomicrobiales bacterium]|nr:alpha-glucosidase/alpha-galactosidase [Thermomicrobiales bacterium]